MLYLKNLGPRVTLRELVALFARFQEEGGQPVQFRLLQGRMRGQAFLTFPSECLCGGRRPSSPCPPPCRQGRRG